MSIHKTSMLVKLTIHCWDGFKKDRGVSQAVDKAFNTSGGAGNYNKRLLDKAVLQPIQRCCNRLRYDHKFLTIPWCYDGVDLLPSKLYFEYTQTMRMHQDAFNLEVDNLIQQYPIHKANQASKLGTMYNAVDYPDRADLKQRFAITHQFFPVPDTGHFVVDLEAKEADKIRKDLTEILSTAQSEALGKVYLRVLEMLEHLHDRLADPANVFRDSLIDNFCQLAEVLPGLNIFDDPKLAAASASIKDLVYVSADVMRRDPKARRLVAEATYDIINQLKASK